MTNPLVRNIIRTFSTQVGCQIIAVAAGIYVARMIGPPSKGFASYATTAVTLVAILFYGFADSVLYQFGKLKYAARAVHSASLRILHGALALIVPVFVVVAVIAPSQRALAAAAIALPFDVVHLRARHRGARDDVRSDHRNLVAGVIDSALRSLRLRSA